MRLHPIRALLRLSLLAAALRAGGPGAAVAAGPAAVCTLTHPSYSGACVVSEPLPRGKTPRAVCGEVLRCLNDSTCAKTYCHATEIRGGWTLESATREGEASAAR